MDYDNTNRGSLWQNQRRSNDRQPDYTGELNVEGIMYRVSCWKKNPNASERAPELSFSITLKADIEEIKGKGESENNEILDGDIPF